MKCAKFFARTNADCVGGRVLAHWDDPPEEAVRRCEKEIVGFDKGERDFQFEGRKVPIGANLAIKVSALGGEGAFVTTLGRTGTQLLGGEEVELLFRLMRRGRRVWYSAGAVVLHRMSGARARQAYYLKREYWNGRCLAIIDRRQNPLHYCHAKAWMRLFQAALYLGPRLLWARITHDVRGELLLECYRQYHVGYWSQTVGLPAMNG